jgi:hypothetical protein
MLLGPKGAVALPPQLCAVVQKALLDLEPDAPLNVTRPVELARAGDVGTAVVLLQEMIWKLEGDAHPPLDPCAVATPPIPWGVWTRVSGPLHNIENCFVMFEDDRVLCIPYRCGTGNAPASETARLAGLHK